MQLIQSKGLSAGSIFKILFMGLLFSVGPLLIIAAICSYFGVHVITLNGVYVFGLKGLLTGLIMAFTFPLLFAGILSPFIILGIWIYTRFKNINIKIKSINTT